MVGAPAGNVVQQILGQVAVWINQTNTMPQRNVLKNHVPQQRCLSRIRLANDVDLLA